MAHFEWVRLYAFLIACSSCYACWVQLHICRGPVAQRLPPGGAIGLVLPDVQKVAQQLDAVQQLLG